MLSTATITDIATGLTIGAGSAALLWFCGWLRVGVASPGTLLGSEAVGHAIGLAIGLYVFLSVLGQSFYPKL